MNKEHLCPVCANRITDHKSFRLGQSVFCKLCQADLTVVFKHKERIVFEHLLSIDEDWRLEENNMQFQLNPESDYGMGLSAQK